MTVNNVIFAATELEAFKWNGNPSVTTNVLNINIDHVRSGTALESRTSEQFNNTFTASSELWFHFNVGNGDNNANADDPFFQVYGASGVLFRILYTNGVPALQMNTSSGFQTVATSVFMTKDEQNVWDIHIKMHDSVGELDWYLNGNIVGTKFTGDTIRMGDNDMISFDFKHPDTDGVFFDFITPSEFVISTDSTVGGKLYTLSLDGAGAHTDFTGLYTDINENGVDDGNSISSSTALDKSTFTTTDLPALNANEIIAAVVTTARIKHDGAAPENAKFITREDGVDYESAALVGITTGYSDFMNVELVDPCTLNSWTRAAVNASEIGIKSET